MSVIFRFADFELDGRSCELCKRGRRLRVQQQPLQILTMLVASPGDVVTRDELRERIWGKSTHVDFDRGINKAITRLRQLLGDNLARPRFIETLPKRGYRFVADVTRLASRRQIKDDAKEAYLKARHFWNKRTPDDPKRSIILPLRDRARSGLPARVDGSRRHAHHDRHLRTPAAGRRFHRQRPPSALALDDRSPRATVLAEIQKMAEWNWDAAERSAGAPRARSRLLVAHHTYAQLLS